MTNMVKSRGAVPVAGIVVVGVLVIFAVIGFIIYNNHAQNERLKAAQRAEMARQERARAEEEARQKRIKDEEEAEMTRRQARLQREKEEEARVLAERERKRKADEAEAERKRQAEKAKAIREIYSAAQNRFQSTVLLESDASADAKMLGAKSENKFWCIFDSFGVDKIIYEVDVRNGVIQTVMALSQDVEAAEVGAGQFKRRFESENVVYTSGGDLWLKCAKALRGSYPVPVRGRNFCVAEESLGRLHGILVGLGASLDEIRCRLTLCPKGSNSRLSLGVIGFGDSLDRGKIEEIVAKKMARKTKAENRTTAKVKKPKFKRTVILYDGDLVRKEMTGITKVPRKFKFLGTKVRGYRRLSTEWKAREKWRELYDEAKRQEKMEKEITAEYEAAIAAEKEKSERARAEAVGASDDDKVIDEELMQCKLYVEYGRRRNITTK